MPKVKDEQKAQSSDEIFVRAEIRRSETTPGEFTGKLYRNGKLTHDINSNSYVYVAVRLNQEIHLAVHQ